MILADYCRGLLDLCLPPVCLVCGKQRSKESGLCDRCLAFKPNPAPYCATCGITAYTGLVDGLCRRCRRTAFYFDWNRSPFLFEAPLSKAVHLFKYGGCDWLGQIFAQKLIEYITTVTIPLAEYDVITFVPLHRVKLREREYNQSRILAQRLGAFFGLEVCPALGVKEYRTSQSRLDYRQRKESVSNNFFVSQQVSGKKMILIDDVFTTGATLSECARVLKEKGAREVVSITLSIRNLPIQKHANNP